MDAKDLRTEAALGERSSDGTSKYTHIGTALPCSSIKNFPEISSNPLAKVETPTSRPCAVIGPDRVLPPLTNTDAYLRKGHYEPWPPAESMFRHPPEYPHKTYQSPIRNISPRQTFQENMQRIMVAPTYNSVKTNEDTNLVLDRNASLPKNNKLSGAPETKYCDVPYSINHLSDTQKNTEMCVSNVNNVRNCPPIWHPSGINIRPTRPYGAPELSQFPEYANCAVSRPMTMPRPPRTMNEENGHLFSESFYHHGNIRFKPYPNVKDRYAQARYEYINNYPNPFHPPPPFPRSKYDLQKPVPSHTSYPQVPIKYLENRISDSVIDGYQRSNQQINYNAPYQNQMIHPAYGPVLPNTIQNKFYPYPQDKTMPANKLPYENNKLYVDYDNSQTKNYPIPENFYMNETRPHVKSQVIIPNYPMNMQHVPPHPYYRKENHSAKSYDYIPHFSINTNNHITRMTPQFSPNSVAISPSDSNTSNETAHTQSNLLEDYGYVSQSSSASIRSVDSGIHRIMQNDIHRRYSYGYPSMVQTPPFLNKMQSNINSNIGPKDKKGIDVRQFLQMWNEGDDENTIHSNEAQIKYNSSSNKSSTQFENKTQEELYVLGLVNVPSEELAKYEHIQKVSKLPDNIKGYNNIELLKQFEEAIESSNLNNFNINKTSTSRNFQSPKSSMTSIPARPISPLDVEAKISQSVIHKEVGCNFEIKPCSPEMMNVEVAAPVRNILEERVIEKVSNPYQSPALSSISENGRNCNVPKQDQVIMLNENNKIPSCKLINTQCSNNNAVNVVRADYSLQDLESNSGVCLASLPRLDNDIELNFPEVNQQFINANKETVITSKESQICSELNKSNLSTHAKHTSDLDIKICSPRESEKEFSKLSKYRKNKKSESEVKEQLLVTNSQFLRTDSVIIKNPDNTKCFEDINKDKIQNNQLILSPSNVLHCETLNESGNHVHEPEIDTAIDFSVSKSASETNRQIFTGNDNTNSNSCYSHNLSETKKNVLQSNEHTVDFDSYNVTRNTSEIMVDDVTLNFSDPHNNNKSPLQCTEEIKKNITPQISTEDVHETKDNIQEEEPTLGPELCDSSSILGKENECDISSKNYFKRKPMKNSEHFTDLLKNPINSSYIEKTKTKGTNINSESPPTKPDSGHDSDLNKKNDTITNDLSMIEPETVSQENPKHTVMSNPYSNKNTKNSNNHNIESRAETTVEGYHPNTLEHFSDESANVMRDKPSNNITNIGKIKSCNLKKELFSPWIQKLIIQSGNILLKTQSIEKNIADINTKNINSPVMDYCVSTICSEEITNSVLNTNISNNITAVSEIPEKHDLTPHIESKYVNGDKDTSIINEDGAVQSINIPVDVPEGNYCTDIQIKNEILIHNIEKCTVISNNEGLVNKNIIIHSTQQNESIPKSNISNENLRVSSEDEEIVDNMATKNTIEQSKTNLSQSSSTQKQLNTDNGKDIKDVIDLINIEDLKEPLNESTKGGDAEDQKTIEYFTEQPEIVRPLKTVTDKTTNDSNKNLENEDNNYEVSQSLNVTCEEFDNVSIKHCKSENGENIISEQNEVFQQDDNIVKKYEKVTNDSTDSENKNISAKNKLTESSNFTIDSVKNASDKDFNLKYDKNRLCLQENSKTLESFNNVCKKQNNINNNAFIESANNTTESANNESNENFNDKVDNNTESLSEQKESIELLNVNKEIHLISQSKVDQLSNNITEKTGCNDCNDPIETNISSTNTSRGDFEESANILFRSKQSEEIEASINITEKRKKITDIEFGSFTSHNEGDSLPNIITEKRESNYSNEQSQDDYEAKDESNGLRFLEHSEVIESLTNSPEKQNNVSLKEFDNKFKDNLTSPCDIDLLSHSRTELKTEIFFSEQNKKSEEGTATDEVGEENESPNILTDNNTCHKNEKERNVSFTIEREINTVAESEVQENIDSASLVETDNRRIIAEQDNVCFIQNICAEVESDHVDSFEQRRRNLKRSLSDSALDMINHDISDEFGNGVSTWSKRRRKNREYLKFGHPDFLSQSIYDSQNNRRNSVSSLHNEDDLSFCIVIDDDYVITQGDEEKICFAQISEDLPSAEEANITEDMTSSTEILLCPQEVPGELSESFVLEISDENDINKSWVDDIGCIETVVSDDVAEDVTVSASSSPKDENVSADDDEIDVYNSTYEHTDKVKYIYGDKMCNDDAEFVETLYRTPQMNVNKTLSNRESHASDEYYEFDEYNYLKSCFDSSSTSKELNDKSSLANDNIESFCNEDDIRPKMLEHHLCEIENDIDTALVRVVKTQDDTVNSCESSIDNVFLYKEGRDPLNIETPSSPEVSSTTSEEKSSSILLKITNYKGMRTSQLNKTNLENSSKNCCKFTENINYTNFNNSSKSRPLITKGAQKYIPPLNETLGDLKVKLPLPQQSLLKLKQLKIERTAPKQVISQRREIPKKPKPRFEDVLKSIDEIQFKMHKEKNKRSKKSVPKVIIKKTENGSHYASVPNNTYFNPDLTGRKWQPWVFIEKNSFIDKMANRKKTKAIYNHRKNTYVLADKFQKYKSVSSSKFIITQPKLDESSMGHLKYTIKLKHSY
ncbi:unnamed protein product [Chilo suppressalis]|uniref:C2H2-type domain-containing protein n=1 Tax=Chilo suppressalis TaxID=168631 RepID=A0ABN8BFQ1_CHISP|nr:unnamed protein product [Chilo suppressalis]